MKSDIDLPWRWRIALFAVRTLLIISIVIVWTWTSLAIFFHPWLPAWLAAPLALIYGAGTIWSLRKLTPRQKGIRWFCGAAAIVWLFAVLPQPTSLRTWSEAHATMPQAAFDGNKVTIRNLRRTVHGFDGGHVIEHYEQTFDLTKLESVWFGVQHFSQWKSLAHTFVSFGFDDDSFLAISIESRRGEGEGFSPLAGSFRNYGVIYVMGDELEVIGWRSVQSDDPIYLYPIRTTGQQRQAMLRHMLERTNELTKCPEFYNTWTNNCTNNIVSHFNEIAPKYISPYSLRIAFPGYTGRVAYDHELIASDETFESIQRRAFINDYARAAEEPAEFSQAIRAGYDQ